MLKQLSAGFISRRAGTQSRETYSPHSPLLFPSAPPLINLFAAFSCQEWRLGGRMSLETRSYQVNDSTLLKEYAESGSQKAFEELVRRHTSLVYSSALRRAGDQHADEITQAVFLILARKAPSLCRKGNPSLAGWLFRTTRYAASEVRRREKRRLEREQIAAERQQMMMEAQRESDAWKQVRPLIDSGLDALPGADREAVLLHYFQGASHAQVGSILGVSENAAAKRVSRAMTKLRRFFARKNIVLSVPFLTGLLSARSIEAASQNLSSSCVSLAVAGADTAVAGAPASLIAQGAMKLMFTHQLRVAALTALMMLSATVGTAAAIRMIATSRAAAVPFRLERLEPFPFTYKARILLPDSNMEFQVNSNTDGRTHFLKLGDEMDSFKVLRHELKGGQRLNPTLGRLEETDLSELTLQRDGREIVLTIDKDMPADKYTIDLVSTADGSRHRVDIYGVFEAGGCTYSVVSVSTAEHQVIIQRLDDETEMVLREER
jgi:RNA polymerase sigma factor (sigma-70 family)